MSLVSNTFQGTNGVNLTAATSGGASGDAFQIVNPSNTDAVEYFSGITNPITLSASVGKIDAALNTSSFIGEVRFVRTGTIRGAMQTVIKFSGAPSASTCVLMQSRGSVQNGDLRVTTGGIIHMALTDGSTVGLSGGVAIDMSPSSPWYVIDYWIEEGTTTANGRAKFRVRSLDDLATVLHSGDSGATRNTGVQGTDTITDWRVGKFTGAATFPVFYIAQFRADDGATDYIANPVAGGQTGNAGVDQTDVEPWATVTLTATGTGTWTQIAGTAVTLSGSGVSRTFTAPANFNGETLTFTYGGDEMTVIVLPATEGVYSSGQWKPVRFTRQV